MYDINFRLSSGFFYIERVFFKVGLECNFGNFFSFMNFIGWWLAIYFRFYGSDDLQLGICFPEHIFKEGHEREVC